MRILVTGADGFLGWHTRARLRALTDHQVVAVGRDRWSDLPELVRGCDAIIHIAGINRATDDEVEAGNRDLAADVADAATAADGLLRVVYANSVHASTETPYGRGKAAAADVLAAVCRDLGTAFVDVRLPNLFGEHGRPGYNSFVATFSHAVAAGQAPTEVQDRPIELLHVQDAAAALIEALTGEGGPRQPTGTSTSVQEVLDTLVRFHEVYRDGDVPALRSKLETDLFNTYRAALFPQAYPIALTPHADDRGRLVETVRSHGGQGQTFVSTTKPGITRGNHFHMSKVERFVVLSGEARISLRRVLTSEVIDFDVSGERPVAIDMPTFWVHSITNTGSTELTTLFWTNTLFDPEAPDTYWEPVIEETA